MKVKSLIETMGRRKVEAVCQKKGWRLPTLEEAKKYSDEIEHNEFWIEGYGNNHDYESCKDELRPLFYSKSSKIAETLSPNFMINVVVIKQDKKCPHCGESCAEI